MTDYLSLFETARANFGFENQLDAITVGDAKMLNTIGSEEDDFIINLEKEAKDRGFVVVRTDLAMACVPKEHRQIQVFIIRNVEESWRIPAYVAIQTAKNEYATISKVSNFFKLAERIIRGYSEEYTRKLFAFENMIQIDYGLATAYIIMPIDYERRLRPLGYRCLDPSTIESPPKLVIFKGRSVSLKPDAAALVGEDHTIARVGVRWHRLLSFLGKVNVKNADDMCFDLSGSDIREFNKIIETEIQLYQDGEWASQN